MCSSVCLCPFLFLKQGQCAFSFTYVDSSHRQVHAHNLTSFYMISSMFHVLHGTMDENNCGTCDTCFFSPTQQYSILMDNDSFPSLQWWKTSRLLVRLSGGYEYCLSTLHWTAMGLYNVSKRKQSKHALKAMKTIGRGGVSKDFLKHVKPFTRSIRIVLAVARGWEARVDNRMFEVLIAEGKEGRFRYL